MDSAREIVSGPLGHQVDEFLTRQSGFGWSGSALIMKGDTVLLSKGYGFADVQRKIAQHPDTAFEIGSLAKQFTAVAILRLEMDGRLTVDDSIGRYLPDVPPDKQAITIHQLLTHSSGLPGDFPLVSSTGSVEEPYEVVARDTAVHRILQQPLGFTPGERYQYSNPGYILLAAIIERVSGQSYKAYVREKIFQPAGLRSTGFWSELPLPGLPDSWVARGHNESGGVLHDPFTRRADTWFDLGGGMVISSLQDLRRWVTVLRDDQLLSASARAKLFQPWVPMPEALKRIADSCAYGWFLQRTPRGTTLRQHGGDYAGTGVQVSWFVDEGVLMIVSTNVRHDYYPTRNRIDRIIPKILFGEPYASPPAFAVLDSVSPDVLGSYGLPTGGRFVVREENDRMFIGAEGQDATDVLAGGPDSVRALRHELSRATKAILEGAWRGDFAPLADYLGSEPNPEFGPAIQEELKTMGQGLGELVGVDVLGTYASGFPIGGSREKTRVRLRYATGTAFYTIHWVGRSIANTMSSTRDLAARIPLQLRSHDSYVGWDIIETTEVSVSFTRTDGEVSALLVRRDDESAVAQHLERSTP